MAEIPTDPRAMSERRGRPRLKLLDVFADAASSGSGAILPKNFGVDLEPPGSRLPQPAGASKPS